MSECGQGPTSNEDNCLLVQFDAGLPEGTSEYFVEIWKVGLGYRDHYYQDYLVRKRY